MNFSSHFRLFLSCSSTLERWPRTTSTPSPLSWRTPSWTATLFTARQEGEGVALLLVVCCCSDFFVCDAVLVSLSWVGVEGFCNMSLAFLWPQTLGKEPSSESGRSVACVKGCSVFASHEWKMKIQPRRSPCPLFNTESQKCDRVESRERWSFVFLPPASVPCSSA